MGEAAAPCGLASLEPASFWPRLNEVLNGKIRGPLLQQLEHKLQVDGDPEYSHLLESLSTPALEEIIRRAMSSISLSQPGSSSAKSGRSMGQLS